jgi:hypothetical protein
MLTMAEVEQEIMRLSGLCEKATHAVKERGQAFAEAVSAFDKLFYQELLRARMADGKTPEWEAKAHAMDVADEWNTARKVTEVAYETAREAGRNYRAQLDALRTIAANLRPLVTDR